MKALSLAIVLAAGLSACANLTPTQVKVIQVACAIEAAAEPQLVSVALQQGGTVAQAATVASILGDPVVKAACAQLGGVPAEVKSGG